MCSLNLFKENEDKEVLCKMADSVVNKGSFSHVLSEITGNNHESNCKECREYELQLNEALDELGSARKIIEIVQKELPIYPTSNNACRNDSASPKVPIKPVNSTEWTLVPARNYSRNPSKVTSIQLRLVTKSSRLQIGFPCFLT